MQAAPTVAPRPLATVISGSVAGAVLYVQNLSSAPQAFGVEGVVRNAGTALVGYNLSQIPGYGVFGATFGPESTAVYGRAYEPEGPNGPTAANQTTGVIGVALNGDGVIGQTTVQHAQTPGTIAGVIGMDRSTNHGLDDGVIGMTTNGGYGIDGISGSGALGGVRGVAVSGYGVVGVSYDNSSNGAAIYGRDTVGSGVIGQGVPGLLGLGTTGAGVVGSSGTFPLVGENAAGAVVFSVNAAGTIATAANLQQLAPARGGAIARTFTPRTTSEVVEDFGTAALVDGRGVVRLDQAFGASIANVPYQVFITPDGESDGLYVAQKTATGFVVRENRNGRSSLNFDYRIVAKPYASSGERIALAALDTRLRNGTHHDALVGRHNSTG